VVRYEEKDPELLREFRQAYPRFIDHHFVCAWESELQKRFELKDQDVYCLCSSAGARELQRYVGFSAVKVLSDAAYAVVAVTREEPFRQKARKFMQHTGLRISSREAEDLLVEAGLLDEVAEEVTVDDPDALVDFMAEQWGVDRTEDVLLANSGMSAVYAGFSALHELQKGRGRHLWIQLGWLYVDTIEILSCFTKDKSHRLFIADATDLNEVERVLERWGDQVAGIFTEAPTNPLMRTADLERLSQIARKFEVALVVDPSTVSVMNVAVLDYADLGVTSITKYVGFSGDVLMGCLAMNSRSPFYEDLKRVLPKSVEPPYHRDVARATGLLPRVMDIVDTINANTVKVAQFLEQHEAVERVFWACDKEGREQYARIAKEPQCPGGLITINLKGRLGPFYDCLRISKGPSFGMKNSLACPFMYIAHYDMVSSIPGRTALRQFGLDPDLVRLAIGAEPVEQIIEALEEALAATIKAE